MSDYARARAYIDYARARAYIDYVKDGEEGLPEGLSFDEYHLRKDYKSYKAKLADEERMLNNDAKVEAGFYNMSEDK